MQYSKPAKACVAEWNISCGNASSAVEDDVAARGHVLCYMFCHITVWRLDVSSMSQRTFFNERW